MNLMYNYINDIEMETADIYILSRDENQFKMSERENKQREHRSGGDREWAKNENNSSGSSTDSNSSDI